MDMSVPCLGPALRQIEIVVVTIALLAGLAGLGAGKRQPDPKYLATPLEEERKNVGGGFVGHNITTVVNAIRNSPALKAKSEFESTSALQARRSGFTDRLLFPSLKPTDLLAFDIEG